MAKSTGDITKTKRPSQTGVPVLVRLQPELLAPLDEASSHIGEASRPEAIRHILRDWLKRAGYLKESG